MPLRIGFERHLYGHVLEPVQRLYRRCRAGGGARVRLPRCDVPDAEDDRRPAGAGEACSAAAVLPAALVGAVFLIWTVVVAVDRNDKSVFPPVLPAALGIAAMVLALLFVLRQRMGIAFTMTGLGAILIVATLFTSLYPRVMVSSTDFSNSLTIQSSASAHYTLAVMSVVALICTPLVLLYQGWSYHVFRHRVGDGAAAWIGGYTSRGAAVGPSPSWSIFSTASDLRRGAELGVDLGEVGLHRRRRQVERSRDLLDREMRRKERHDPKLRRREVKIERRARYGSRVWSSRDDRAPGSG